MKLTTGINILKNKNLDKIISKKILLANTSSKISGDVISHAKGISNDPLYNTDNVNVISQDIRYRNQFSFSPLNDINYRNSLLIFAENKEIKKAVNIIANEVVVIASDHYKYPVTPIINKTLLDISKQKTCKATQQYLDEIFYPKLYNMLKFKKDGLIQMLKDFLITGKIAYEIIYDDLKNPKNIIGIQPLDPSTLQKFIDDDVIYYIQKSPYGGGDRVLVDNQVILLEYNKYDFGYVSFVDGLRMSFNIMRSMQTSKILWFATKSQVRMHIKFAFGDVSRQEALQKLTEARNNYTNKFTFNEDGQVLFNNKPNNNGYREFFTAETNTSGHPEIEEVEGNGPDLTEVDSLNYWERLYWNDTGIPMDRIDPNNTDSWGFKDVESLNKTEIIFAKQIESIRKMTEDVFLKPIIIQLTLLSSELGSDLNLLDSIRMEWVTYNQYEKMADLEMMSKKIELAQSIKDFSTIDNANGDSVDFFPMIWVARNVLDLTDTELQNLDNLRYAQMKALGFTEEAIPHLELNIEDSEEFKKFVDDGGEDGMDSTEEPAEEPTEESTEEPTEESTEESQEEPAEEPAEESTEESTEETSEESSESTEEPEDEEQ